jgi:hypothetical protein
LRYGVLPPGSVARDKADPARAPADDILGRPRGESPDLGAFEVQPAPEAATLVDAAAFTGQLAPGSLASIFGRHLSDGTVTAAQLPLPQSLAGVSVMLGGKPAPLLFVSPGQINLQIHYDNSDGAALTISRAGLSGTGLGQLSQPLEAGQPAESAVTVTAPVCVLFQNSLAEAISTEPLYAGLAVGFAGLNQVNVAMPPRLTGSVALVMEAAGSSSPAVPLWAAPGQSTPGS